MARLAIKGGPAVAPPGLRTIWPVFGDAGAFSFQASKTLNCGEGLAAGLDLRAAQ